RSKITPLFFKIILATSSLFFIKVNQVERLNLSLYLKESFPVLYGGSIYIIFTLFRYFSFKLCNTTKLFPLIIKLSLSVNCVISCTLSLLYFFILDNTLNDNNVSISSFAKVL